MNIQVRLKSLMDERKWSEYRLAKEAGVSQTTITNLFKRNNLPTLPTLEAICKAFNITLAQFFIEDDTIELTSSQKELLRKWNALSAEQQKIMWTFLNALYEENQSSLP